MMFPASDAPSIEVRFLEKMIPEPNSGCWLWTASLTNKGYGEIMLKHSRRTAYAHRISYQLFKGDVPPKAKILHSCDMPCCVNPDHLRIGTQRDNILDMYARGRRVTLPKEYPAGLSALDVLNIHEDKRSSREIAKDYGVSHTSILYVKKMHASAEKVADKIIGIWKK